MSTLRSVFVGCAGGLLALGLMACSNGEYPSTLPQTTAPLITIYPGAPAITPTPATTRPGSPSGTAAPTGATVTFTTADGVSATLPVTSCTSRAADSATLSAASANAKLDVQVTAASGTATFTGPAGERAGTVTELEVDGQGRLTATGNVTSAGRPATTFRLTGTC